MMLYLALKYLHVIGAAVLLGTGAGIAFFMLRAHLTGEAAVIAAVPRLFLGGDFLFPATAGGAPPDTRNSPSGTTRDSPNQNRDLGPLAPFGLNRAFLVS